MKKIALLLFVLIVSLSGLFNGCKKKQQAYYQFTDEDLKWIYYQNMSPKYAVYDFDTIQVNGHDSIFITHKRDIVGSVVSNSSKNDLTHSEDKNPYYFDEGESVLSTCQLPYIIECRSECSIYKTADDIVVSFYLIGRSDPTNENVQDYKFEMNQSDITFTTCIVNNNQYSVLKFCDFSNSSMYKEVLFCKGFGFIKIELKDGRKIELLN